MKSTIGSKNNQLSQQQFINSRKRWLIYQFTILVWLLVQGQATIDSLSLILSIEQNLFQKSEINQSLQSKTIESGGLQYYYIYIINNYARSQAVTISLQGTNTGRLLSWSITTNIMLLLFLLARKLLKSINIYYQG